LLRFGLGCWLAAAVALAGGCSNSDEEPDLARDTSTHSDGAQTASVSGNNVPPPGVFVPSQSSAERRPFRAIGHVRLSGKPPFAQPVLVLDDGSVYQLGGPERSACVRRNGRRLDVSGTIVGTSTSHGVSGVVEVTRYREVGR
jgi:hypothetical protein